MKPRIIFRADGNSAIGMGHIVRSLALADMLKDDFEIIFAVQEPDEDIQKKILHVAKTLLSLQTTSDFKEDLKDFLEYLKHGDIVVLDGYNFKTEYQRAIKDRNCKLVCIDDLHAWHFVADTIINHAEGVDSSLYSMEPYTKLFFGIDYVLLRKIFLKQSQHKTTSKIRKVFISMGAADANNLTRGFSEALVRIDDIEEIHMMLGSVNPNIKDLEKLSGENANLKIISHVNISAEELKELLLKCDIAICPASSISLECCSTGIGLITGFTSENQMGILNGLLKFKAAVNLGDMTLLNVDSIKKKLSELFEKPELFYDIKNSQRKMIDGKSPERLLKIFNELAPKRLSFRFAKDSDVDLYFKWANDPVVRSNSYNQNPVEYSGHVKWFKAKLASGKCFFYLFSNENGNDVGQVRIDSSAKEVVIGISIDQSYRGKSYGTEMLKIACTDFLEKNPGKEIAAYIKSDNSASYNIFKKAGFGNESTLIEQGFKSYKLIHKLDS